MIIALIYRIIESIGYIRQEDSFPVAMQMARPVEYFAVEEGQE